MLSTASRQAQLQKPFWKPMGIVFVGLLMTLQIRQAFSLHQNPQKPVTAVQTGDTPSAQILTGRSHNPHIPPYPSPYTMTNSITDTSPRHLAPDIKTSALAEMRGQAPFIAMDFPRMVKAPAVAFLNENEYVLGITSSGESRAYPTRLLAFHHVINDNIATASGGETPVAITYCSVCNMGACYDPDINGKRRLFGFYGLYNGIAALYERQSQGVFLPAEGRIITGAMTGTHFKSMPMLDTTWGQWKRLHPATLVMSPETPFKKFYGTLKTPIKRLSTDYPPFFGPTITHSDTRLAPFDAVLAVTLPTETMAQTPLHRAYSFHSLQRAGDAVNDTLGKRPVGVLLDPHTLTAIALSRQFRGRTLTFEAHRQTNGVIAFYDHETHTRWNLEGKGEEGPLKGQYLERLDNHLCQWYGWVASFPDTSIYGRRDPPQSGNSL